MGGEHGLPCVPESTGRVATLDRRQHAVFEAQKQAVELTFVRGQMCGENQELRALPSVQAELERLKRQHAEREAQKQAERVAASAAASFSGRAAPADSPLPAQGPPQMTEELKRTLKVSCCTKLC